MSSDVQSILGRVAKPFSLSVTQVGFEGSSPRVTVLFVMKLGSESVTFTTVVESWGAVSVTVCSSTWATSIVTGSIVTGSTVIGSAMRSISWVAAILTAETWLARARTAAKVNCLYISTSWVFGQVVVTL